MGVVFGFHFGSFLFPHQQFYRVVQKKSCMFEYSRPLSAHWSRQPIHSPSALTEHVSSNLAGIFLLDPVNEVMLIRSSCKHDIFVNTPVGCLPPFIPELILSYMFQRLQELGNEVWTKWTRGTYWCARISKESNRVSVQLPGNEADPLQLFAIYKICVATTLERKI